MAVVKCGACGFENPFTPGMRFCNGCGKPFEGGGDAPAVADGGGGGGGGYGGGGGAPQQQLVSAGAGTGVIRMRGLPWSTQEQEIKDFFQGFSVQQVLIMFDALGRPKGDCFVSFVTEDDAARAVAEKDRQTIGSRYVELFPSTAEEMRGAAQHGQGIDTSSSLLLRCRGIPYSATEQDVGMFFQTNNVHTVPGSAHIQIGPDGRPSGQAFIRCASEQDAAAGLALHKEGRIGARYVEVYRASDQELKGAMEQQAAAKAQQFALAGTAGTEFIVKLRGLPFAATELDVANFFNGLAIAPQGIHLVYNADNRPSGECFVEFQGPHDVNGALQKDKHRVGHRYVEVFRSSSLEMHGGGSAPAPAAIAGSPYGGGGGGGWGGPPATAYGGGGGGGGGGSRPGDWNCPACGFMNFASRTNCKQCNGPKGW